MRNSGVYVFKTEDETPISYPHKIVSLAAKGKAFFVTFEDEKRERSLVIIRVEEDGLI
jgi:hypothetical protein